MPISFADQTAISTCPGDKIRVDTRTRDYVERIK